MLRGRDAGVGLVGMGRHGQSEYNLAQKIGGDSSLTPHGREYAVALAAHVHECAPRTPFRRGDGP